MKANKKTDLMTPVYFSRIKKTKSSLKEPKTHHNAFYQNHTNLYEKFYKPIIKL